MISLPSLPTSPHYGNHNNPFRNRGFIVNGGNRRIPPVNPENASEL